MTLALTIVSRHGIWQSSDMRLLNVSTGRSAPDGSTKQFRLELHDGVALVTYAGVGQLHGTHVSNLVVDLLRGQQRTLNGTLEALVAVANERIASELYHLPPDYRIHTFAIGSFRDDKPVFAEVRNVDIISQSAHSTTLKLRADFTSSKITIGDCEGIASIAGAKGFVRQQDRALLHSLRARKPHLHEDRRAVLATVNEHTARNAPRIVSRECWTWHATGHREQEPEAPKAFTWGGTVPASSNPRTLTHGFDFHAAMASMMEHLQRISTLPGDTGYINHFSEAVERGMRLAIRLEIGLRIHHAQTRARGTVRIDPVPGGDMNDIGIAWDADPSTVVIEHRGAIIPDH
jgi:hypothetical protein